MQDYIDLHRHAAVRDALTGHPSVALRLMAAHAVIGSHLWNVRPVPQTTRNDAVRESVETCRGETDFDAARRAVLALLDFDPDAPTVCGGNGDDYGVAGLFLRLLGMPDEALLRVIAVVMGEALASGSAAVDAVGLHLGVDMAEYWQADEAFFASLRDKQVLGAIVGEVAGKLVAEPTPARRPRRSRRSSPTIWTAQTGARVERWVPRWMRFPPSAYTDRRGVGSVAAHAKVAAAQTTAEAQTDDDLPPWQVDEPAIDAGALDGLELADVPETGGDPEDEDRLAA